MRAIFYINDKQKLQPFIFFDAKKRYKLHNIGFNYRKQVASLKNYQIPFSYTE